MNLKILRKEHEMTQKDLANRIGVSDATIGAWENGRNNISIKHKKQLAEIFRTNPDEIQSETHKHINVDTTTTIKQTLNIIKQQFLSLHDTLNDVSLAFDDEIDELFTSGYKKGLIMAERAIERIFNAYIGEEHENRNEHVEDNQYSESEAD